MADNNKPWYLSETIWVNILSMIIFVIVLLTGISIDAEPEEMMAISGGIVAAINIILRTKTTKGITLKK